MVYTGAKLGEIRIGLVTRVVAVNGRLLVKKRFDSVKGVAWLPVVLVAILCAGVLQLIETSYGAEKATIASAEEIPSGVQAQSIPVVSPDQPEVGIEEDHYLDKSPVRETKGLIWSKINGPMIACPVTNYWRRSGSMTGEWWNTTTSC